MALRNVRIEVSYDGSRFYGWQRQDGFETVQQSIEEALAELLDTIVVIHGAGRTDTGVHGLRQVAHFHIDAPRIDDDRLRHALNAHLPPGIAVRRAETCADDFHARFHATGKRYAYVIQTTRFPPAIGREFVHWDRTSLDGAAMREAARRMEGERDFAAFGNVGSPRKSTVRRVDHVRLVMRRERFAIVVQGNGFLYNMVRTMAGTLLAVGKGRMTPDDVTRALESRDRKLAGPTAPPNGLYMVRVLYPERPFVGREQGPGDPPGPLQY
ncbi:tRNA pseudouridine synthase A [Planctomycetes bacterium Poly30]|uniref:tRNA pseudouridine synthase A n=1 Tax=Saltatorellus ferox TaxID=2528018 RepID=A0A518EWD6_9BACT|nr:tRNA pseudouridine synthase A [Planctomycetes bacterium Poly30]